jgi:hypothetical protein
MVVQGCKFLVQGVDLTGVEQTKPVLLQMHDDDFPARFLQDLASPTQPKISNTKVLDAPMPLLYQPVQRFLNVAMIDLRCDSVMNPPVEPRRIVSAGLVLRRVYRAPDSKGSFTEEFGMHSAWMRDPKGKFSWTLLSPDQENLDPDPTKRPQLHSGQTDVDQQLAALTLSQANTESTTPAFAIPPATCAALHRTIFYAVIPTASSEMSDTPPPSPPLFDRSGLVQSLPAILRSKHYSSSLTVPSVSTIDYRWMSDDFLNGQYPPTATTSSSGVPSSTPDSRFTWFHGFATALRMLNSVFNAFDPNSSEGAKVLSILNRYNVHFSDHSTPMGQFYQQANSILLPTSPTPWPPTDQTLPMPASWDGISHKNEKELVDAMVAALTPASKTQLAPQGRFQDSSRYYKLRMFFRIKPESGNCPPKLVWSHYSAPFQIAPWHATGPRPHPPIPLPDPTGAFLAGAKPNCSFQVPGSLMSAMQGTTMSGLMNGSGGGGGMTLNWICGFNIPLITICAFFVLNIFLSLLNIVFFWLPIIKICIPVPTPSPSNPDGG